MIANTLTIPALVLVPLSAGVAALMIRPDRLRRIAARGCGGDSLAAGLHFEGRAARAERLAGAGCARASFPVHRESALSGCIGLWYRLSCARAERRNSKAAWTSNRDCCW